MKENKQEIITQKERTGKVLPVILCMLLAGGVFLLLLNVESRKLATYEKGEVVVAILKSFVAALTSPPSDMLLQRSVRASLKRSYSIESQKFSHTTIELYSNFLLYGCNFNGCTGLYHNPKVYMWGPYTGEHIPTDVWEGYS